MPRIYLFSAGIILIATSLFFIAPPFSYPSGSIVTVAEGTGLYALAQRLKEDKVIRSPFLFRMTAIILGGERNMQAGQYMLPSRQNVFTIAWRVSRGDYDIETVKLTIPEGFNVKEISALFDERFTLFDHSKFEEIAPVGYLFPDTYFVQVAATASSTIKLLNDNFVNKIAPIMSEIESSGKSLDEIIIMASLLEAEAKTKEERAIAAGILWKRLKLGMPLQVDSEMGTYEYAGLPSQPINNPGLISIKAAIHPAASPYLYFLTDKDGTMHYAKTFDEHKKNITKYLSH